MRCQQCGEEVQLPFRCSYCECYFCLKHRLPESHNCPETPKRTPLGSSQNKKEMTILRAERRQQTIKPLSQEGFNFGKRELPTFRFNKKSRKKTNLRFPKRKRRK
ncbi:AN1-type zinc finger domain-containing protein [Candidatus Bathyarchaeota archaeon]|nr:AN1-type zinc finger domain-containing protein [Candidatus Bathyarchaeota archaeon]